MSRHGYTDGSRNGVGTPPGLPDDGPLRVVARRIEHVLVPRWKWTVTQGDCLDVLRGMSSNTYDALLSDPPAGIGFMGREWDKDKGGRDAWIAWLAETMREALRVLKPGAHGLVWSLPRTSHWTATALEDAGFEVRDCVAHCFGTGFPKSHNVSKALDKALGATREVVGVQRLGGNACVSTKDKGGTYGVQAGTVPAQDVPITRSTHPLGIAYEGYGTSLKPAMELWWLVRKPLEGTVASNAAKWGTGALAIDACRIGETPCSQDQWTQKGRSRPSVNAYGKHVGSATPVPSGRWPANLTLDEAAAAMIDAQSGERRGMSGGGSHRADYKGGMFGSIDAPHLARGDTGGASRFFYVAKPSSGERHRGAENKHPTIKGAALTRWLAALIKPPIDDACLLVPFAGSGGEMIGGVLAGFARIYGIERDEEFAQIARSRVEHACSDPVAWGGKSQRIRWVACAKKGRE